MKLVKTLIAIAAIGVGSQVFGKAYPGLEVGFTFREVDVLVENLDEDEDAKKIGLTTEDVRRAAKLKLLTRGFKVIPKEEYSPSGSYIYIRINLGPTGLAIGINLSKNPQHFGIPSNRGVGPYFKPAQGSYSGTGNHTGDKKFILDSLETFLDIFILDYLESNLKYEATLKDKKLRDIDRVIKESADTPPKKYWITHKEWYKRYDALMKEK
jgi:hypothetical protein